MFSDSRGDVAPGSTGGQHEDTRFVSRWELRLDGAPLSLLKSGPVDYDSAAFFLTNPDTSRLRAHSVAVRRLRHAGSGALEQITVFNTSSEPVTCELRLLCGADFADLFEIRSGVHDRSGSIVAAARGRQSLRFRYQVPGFLAETTIRIERSEIVEGATEEVVAAAPPRVDGTDAVWELELPPRCPFVALVEVGVRVNNVTFEPVVEGFGSRQQPVEGPSSDWLERIPRVGATSTLLTDVVRQSVVDLAALRITGDLLGERYVLPAAGRRRLRRVPDALAGGPRQPVLEGLVGRGPVADGTIPHLPIATSEVQGYVDDAKLRPERRLRSDADLAERLEREAEDLSGRFNDDFWSDDRGGYYVVGLDGDKRRIDSTTSNIGHLLWSGIVPQERAGLVARQLMSDAMFSGWASARCRRRIAGTTRSATTPERSGRTTTRSWRSGSRAQDSATRRIGSHWRNSRRPPSRATGCRRPSPASSAGSAAFRSRTRRRAAWATAAPFVFVPAILGLEARDGELRLDPRVPEELGRIVVRRLHAFGTEWDVEAAGAEGIVCQSGPAVS